MKIISNLKMGASMIENPMSSLLPLKEFISKKLRTNNV